MINGVIYARYSCEKQTENSILGQVRECQEFARKNDINIINIYKDEAKSGRDTKHRHDFLRMVRDANHKLFNCVIVWKGDRFSRSRADAARYKGELKKLGVSVLSATEANMTGPEAILMDGINEAFAEYFSVELAAKVERGMTQNAIDGKFNGGTMTFGYKLDENRKLVIDERDGEVVKYIFTTYLHQDISIAQLYRDIYRKGMIRRDGRRLSKNTITAMLSNKRYIGIYEFKGTQNKTMFPRLISDIDFEEVQKKMKRNKRISGKFSTPDTYFLTGKLICAECGHLMTSYSGTGKDKKIRKYYRCLGTKVDNCHGPVVEKNAIERVIFEEIASFVSNDNYIEMAVTQLLKYQAKGNPELENVRIQIAELDKKIARLNYAISEGIDFESTIDQLKEYKTLREDLNRQYHSAKINAKVYTPDMLRAALKMIAQTRIDTPEGKKKIIAMFVNKIYLNNQGNIKILFNVLNGNEPIIAERWFRTSTCSDHQWRITQAVEGVGLENR